MRSILHSGHRSFYPASLFCSRSPPGPPPPRSPKTSRRLVWAPLGCDRSQAFPVCDMATVWRTGQGCLWTVPHSGCGCGCGCALVTRLVFTVLGRKPTEPTCPAQPMRWWCLPLTCVVLRMWTRSPGRPPSHCPLGGGHWAPERGLTASLPRGQAFGILTRRLVPLLIYLFHHFFF